jgi:hypothetical protein
MVLSEHSQGGNMTYDIPPPKKLPEPGYYYHFKHDPDGPLNNYAYYIYGVGHHTEDDWADQKMLSCKCTDRYTNRHMPTGMAGSSIYAPSTCFLNRRFGGEKRYHGSLGSSIQT